jgi:hypothetical protein
VSSRRRLTTDDQRQWLFRAKQHGGLCAACGRSLRDDEAVYLELVEVELKVSSSWSWKTATAKRDAPLGEECASQELVERASRASIDPCEGCGRPVFHGVDHAGRRHTACSKRCLNLTRRRARQAERGEVEL